MTTANSESFEPRQFLKTLTTRPGVYKMLDARGAVIYVGKARNLKNRVSSYFSGRASSAKTHSMVAQVAAIETIVTRSDSEALLLENNLIKELRPRYNIVLRDDKSYPYIYLSADPFPRLGFHRGARSGKGRYFGPYPSASAVRESLQLLQKVFPVRQCEDSFYRNRSRPCLQYQIKRCTAPCVGLVDETTYSEDVRRATLFLEGKSQQVVEELIGRMERAAAELDFERAAGCRDQIGHLRRLQESQYVTGDSGNVDVIAAAVGGDAACVQVFFIRDGRNLGNRSYFPGNVAGADAGDVLSAFLSQHYAGKPTPDELLISAPLPDDDWLAEGLTRDDGRLIPIRWRVKGSRARWLAMARENAERALATRLAGKATSLARLDALQSALGLDDLPERMECFDVSHTQGEETVASCVVFQNGEPLKSDYRRFNVKDVVAGDDYGAMRQVLNRRFRKLMENAAPLPDVLFIDGGRGQVNAAVETMANLQVPAVCIVGVAKGEGRRPGLETLHFAQDRAPLQLPSDSPALLLVQQIRDEAHRFAITGHRQRRGKARQHSALEEINGLGPKRRRALLTHFGGMQALRRAAVEDLAQVPGVSRALAERIYAALHIEDN